ncbi:hypothetical protein [Desemzia sp. FAM 23991]|uniref:hypothetical protein n=1 Tax=unclassified Desemzia TaxID=2685243 RepID=UPI00388A4972
MNKLLGFTMSVFFLLGLTACSQSPEEKILGKWELNDGRDELNYWEITEDEIIITSESGKHLSTQGYIITELEDTENEKFRIEFNELANESMGSFEGLADLFDVSIEGYFKNENSIIGTSLMNSSSIGDFELNRVKEGEAEEITSKNETSSSDEKIKLYSMSNLEYSIPENWTEEISDENLKYYYPEEAMLLVSYIYLDDTLSNDETRENFIEGVASESESYDLIAESEITVAGTIAYQYDFNSIMTDQEFENSLVIFDHYDGIMAFQMSTLVHSDKDYSNAFESILSSIDFTDE